MIRLAFMTDETRVIGASTEQGNAARFEVMPPALAGVMRELYHGRYAGEHIVVGAGSLGQWTEAAARESKVWVLGREPRELPEGLEQVTSIKPLVDRFANSVEELLVAGGATTLRLLLPYATRIDIALTDATVPGDVRFDEWDDGSFGVISETPWDGGRTLHLVRTRAAEPATLELLRLSNAVALYMQGIRDGDARRAIYAYTGARYTQHSTGVPDGPEGFLEFFEPFLARNPERDIRAIRGWADGRKVFLHVFQSLNESSGEGAAQWVTTDLFDTDDEGKIIEHWDVIAAYAPKTPSGHTSVDGPGEIRDLPATDRNKQVVRDLITNVLMRGGDPSRVGEYISAERYVEHNAEVSDGLAAFRAALEADERALWYDEIVLLTGRGNFVSTLCKTNWKGQPFAQVDIFRLEDGRVVEHWDCAEPCPPPQQLANSGKF